MKIEDYSTLIENKSQDFESNEADFVLLAKYKNLLNDNSYFDFVIKSQNCGFFYGQSLHLYGYSQMPDFDNIEFVNSLLQNEYDKLFSDLISFGQDVFGNQFCFDIVKKCVVFFNCESGERDIIASNFTNWIEVLNVRLSYFTGVDVLTAWLSDQRLEFNQRLCPKMPFIMGGEFKPDNLYAGVFPNFVKAYANIARQVFNLPDGTKVKINIEKKKN